MQMIDAHAAVVPLAQQRRRHKRDDLCFKVQFRILEEEEAAQALAQVHPLRVPSDPRWVERHGEVYALNLSHGGLGLCGDLRRLPNCGLCEGDLLQITLSSPRDRGILHCLGNVAWVSIDDGAGLFRAGVSFVAVQLQDLMNMGWDGQGL